MHVRPRALPLVVIVLAWDLLGASSVRASDRFAAPAAGAMLEGGATVRVGWSLPRADARGFGEMELVLSLDGGRTFPVRVTRDLDPATRSFAWRVPALPAAGAHLALRAGDGGEPGDEEILLVSEEFAIEIDPSSPLEPTASVRGEWRTREALDGEAGAPPDPRTFGAAGPVLHPARELPSAAAGRPRPLAGARAIRCAANFESVPRATLALPRLDRPCAPTQSPLRE